MVVSVKAIQGTLADFEAHNRAPNLFFFLKEVNVGAVRKASQKGQHFSSSQENEVEVVRSKMGMWVDLLRGYSKGVWSLLILLYAYLDLTVFHIQLYKGRE